MMPVNRPHYERIPPDRDIVFLASGGRDSTAMVLEAYQLGLKGILLFGDTRFNGRGKKVVQELAEYTSYTLHIATYDGKERPIDVLNQSFKNIPITLERQKTCGRFQRNYFYCCNKLKHGPMDRYLERLSDLNIIQVLGLKKTDGNVHRRLRLGELRSKKQFYRIKANGSMFWYPLRDCTDKDVSMILDEHGFSRVSHSGCWLCPILCMFVSAEDKDPEAYRVSMDKAKRMGIIENDGQEKLEAYI